VKAFFWFLAAAAMCAVLIGVWMLNNEFVADTLEARFEETPSEGWRYWHWRESWPAIAFGVLPCAGAAIYCVAKGVAVLNRRS
jgi:hypothetical protein